MVNRIARILLVLAITLTCLIQSPISLRTYADDGITKTATAITATCPGGRTVTCTLGTMRYDGLTKYRTNVQECGLPHYYTQETATCTGCGKRAYKITGSTCSACGEVEPSSGSLTLGTHTYTSTCSHGYTSQHTYTSAYTNVSYGYSGSSSTFKVWPITIVGNSGLTGTVSVSGCTATDAAMSGKSVTVKVTGVTNGTKLKIANSGTGATTTPTTSSTSYSYTFTMPAKPTTITIELAQVALV